MNEQAGYFKDDILKGIGIAIKNLQAQDSEMKVFDPKASKSITKSNCHFRSLINSVDLGLSFGLKDAGRGYWPFIKKIGHSSVIKFIDNHKKATNDINKGYIWLYTTFIEQSLESYIKVMTSEIKLIKYFYKEFALLRDSERSDIFRTLLTGMEKLTFSLDINEPYLDYGHDPILRHEKVEVCVAPSTNYFYEKPLNTSKSTIRKNSKRSSDSLNNLVRPRSSTMQVFKSPVKQISSDETNQVSKSDDEDLVYTSKCRKSRLAKNTQIAVNSVNPINDSKATCDNDQEASTILDNQPEVFTQLLDSTHKSSKELLNICDPITKNTQVDYESFLNNLKPDEGNQELQQIDEVTKGFGNEVSISDEIHELHRVDSFDKFCRSSSDSTDELIPNSSSVTTVAQCEQSYSFNKNNIPKLNTKLDAARLNTKNGILLPSLPKRPSSENDAKRLLEFELSENTKVVLSVKVFQHPNESFVKMFEVNIAFLAGYDIPILLLISNIALYFLRPKGQNEYEKVMTINIGSINKIKVGLNFQDVFISYDSGCLHFSTGNETLSRYLVSTIKCVICSYEFMEQLIAPNTNNDLYLILQDWLLCQSQYDNEDPSSFYFALIYYSDSITKERGDIAVLKNGYLQYHEIGLFSAWEEAYFTLRGCILHRYSRKKPQQSKSICDLRTCGGCIRNGKSNEWFTCKILGEDGITPIMELAAFDENEINEWIFAICQVVADSKHDCGKKAEEAGNHCNLLQCGDNLLPCGVLMTNDKIIIFNQDIKSGSLIIKDSFCIKDITQVYVDNCDRTFCALALEQNFEENVKVEKRIVLAKFHSEFELGKFEKELAPRWNILYQVPLQFVLVNDELKKTINRTLNYRDNKCFDIGLEVLRELIIN
ncbi:uncharacterized protein LOC101237678 isoform X2 [Hydra vulgaris]|uniref:Uncharacterized protein LOC101237678 isoform X2 n=1 Tax=Hydra vulgaris TaxID=6087 RepID=A0ABM4C180_HYDVU